MKFTITCCVVSLPLCLGSCDAIPGDPYIRPVPNVPNAIEAGWEIPFPNEDSGDMTLTLTTRAITATSRIFVLTCDGGPGDELEWTASTLAQATSLLEDIAEDTYMVLPSDPSERSALFSDVEDWISNEWMTADAYHAATGY